MRKIAVLTGLTLALAGSAQAAPVIVNPGFESDNRADNDGNGYGPITGWTGGSGTNAQGQPFHNGSGAPVPEGTLVAFQQGVGTLSQDVSGFVTGETYQLTYRESSRNSTTEFNRPDVEVTLDGVTIVPRHFVAKNNPYAVVTSAPFTYTGTDGTGLLALTNFTPATNGTNDNTALWDAFTITVVPEPASAALLCLGGLGLMARRRV